jgi:hypothetical protein
VVARPGSDGRERAGFAVEGRNVAGGRIAPSADLVGHKADAVSAIAVVEAVDVHHAVAVAEVRAETDVEKRVACRGAVQRHFVNAPPLDALCGGQAQAKCQSNDQLHGMRI